MGPLTLPSFAVDTVSQVPHDARDATVARHTISKTAAFWVGCSFTMLNINLGILGPWKFSLSTTSATLAGLTGVTLGIIPVALVACLGPTSGLNTMVLTRFSMGWYPAKFICLLSATTIMGYAILEVIAAGNMLTALFPAHRFSDRLVIAGVAAISTAVAMASKKVLHGFERWAWFPQLLAVCVLFGASAQNYTSLPPAARTGHTGTVQDAVAFCGLVFADAISYTTTAADLFVHYPHTISRKRMVLGTIFGAWASLSLLLVIGIGLGSGTSVIPSWRDACLKSPAVLIATAYEPLGTIGVVCCVVLALGAIGPTAAGIYSNGVALQASCTPMHRVPHYLLVALCGVFILVCAVAANDHLAVMMGDIVSSVGYWGCPWIAIFAGDYLLRKGGYCWSDWEDRRGGLPKGVPASISFVIGLTVAILCAAQSWMTGPVAKAISPQGTDVSRELQLRFEQSTDYSALDCGILGSGGHISYVPCIETDLSLREVTSLGLITALGPRLTVSAAEICV